MTLQLLIYTAVALYATIGHSIEAISEAGADPGFDGGAQIVTAKLPMVRSSVVRAKRALFSMGSGAHLRAPEALGYFITKYAFSPFWGTFLYYF